MKNYKVIYIPVLESLLARAYEKSSVKDIDPFRLCLDLDWHSYHADTGLEPGQATVAECVAGIESAGFYVWYKAESEEFLVWLSPTVGFDTSLLHNVLYRLADLDRGRVESGDDIANYHSLAIDIETAFYQHQIQQYENMPLVSVNRLRELVEGFSKLYPVEWTSPYEHDNDEYANEIGFDSVDRYSIYQMLRKNAGMTVSRKQEIMTIFAYINQLKISPFALAITPRVIGELRQHGALKVAPHNE